MAVAKLKGADKKNPQRYRDYLEDHPLPFKCPDYITGVHFETWEELASAMLPGLLTHADAVPFEMLVNMIVEYRIDPPAFAVGKYAPIMNFFSRFGMTPSDRRKLAIEKGKEKKNEFDGF